MDKILSKKNLNTVIMLVLFLVYFVVVINYFVMWFSDMGTNKLSMLDLIASSFITLTPYWIISLIGILRKFKSEKINYTLFAIIFFS